VQSMSSGPAEVVEVPNLPHEQRWPQYVPHAVAHGVRSQLAVKMQLDDEGSEGGLNLYSTSTRDIEPETVETAKLFAVHAAIALGSAREIENLNEALHTRKHIGQAIGILMNQYTLTEDAAFGFLVRMSSHSNTKLREVAATMVSEAEARAAAVAQNR
jgi:GAF domain-containing protein